MAVELPPSPTSRRSITDIRGRTSLKTQLSAAPTRRYPKAPVTWVICVLPEQFSDWLLKFACKDACLAGSLKTEVRLPPNMSDATGTPGTLYDLKDETNPAVTQTASAIVPVPPSVYNAVKTTYAIGVGGDGGTTYILSQEITRVDLFDTATSPVSTNTEPHTLVQTIVAGADYQKGTYAFLSLDAVAPTGLSQIEYSCSYDLGHGSGQCVREYHYATTTYFMTLEGGLQAVATLSPFPHNGQGSGTQSSGTHPKVATGAIVGGVIGGILAIGFLLAILFVLRRRRLRSRRY